jgi:alkylation response protein AidB-like acyl-CoA dehydrogenase
MEFGLSEDQRLIDQTLRAYLADTMPLDDVRRVAEQRSGFDDQLWQGLVELGIPGLLIADEFGGAGLGVLDAAVVAEAMGYAAAPTPFIGACVMAPLAIRYAGNEEQRQSWLPAIAAGEMRVAVSLAGLSGATGRSDLDLADGKLSGTVSGLLDSGAASHALVYLPNGQAAMVALDSGGVSLAAQPSLDRTRPLASAAFDGATASLLDGANDATEAAMRVLDAGRVILAADTLGAGQCMIDKAVDYAGQRVQFERVIASFQAVKHMCAEMVAALEPCRALVWYAAHAQDAVEEERRLVANLTKAHVAEVGRDVARTATEVHGGMGFTDLMGLHYWFKRISFDRQVLGGPERCRQVAARLQGWAAD